MDKSLQTPELKKQVYDLTSKFVRAYQKLYYVQYQGEIEDLVSSFFLDFITPKSREEGKEESLLDKYDGSVTSLTYLVALSVKRKLIDESRKDKNEVRFQINYDEKGDCILDRLNLFTPAEEQPTVDEVSFDYEQYLNIAKRYSKLSLAAKEAFRSTFIEQRNVLAPAFRKLFDFVLKSDTKVSGKFLTIAGRKCKVFQVTDKSVQIVIDNEIVTFNRETGQSRKGPYSEAGEFSYSLDEANIILNKHVVIAGVPCLAFENGNLLKVIIDNNEVLFDRRTGKSLEGPYSEAGEFQYSLEEAMTTLGPTTFKLKYI